MITNHDKQGRIKLNNFIQSEADAFRMFNSKRETVSAYLRGE